jgi:hypothetical protein
LHEKDIEAIDWAGENLPAHSSILASPKMAAFIPSRTPLKTVMGHPHLSPGFYANLGRMNYLYEENPDPYKLSRVIHNLDAEYLYCGTIEKIFWRWDFNKMPFLRRVYTNGFVSIYKVIP